MKFLRMQERITIELEIMTGERVGKEARIINNRGIPQIAITAIPEAAEIMHMATIPRDISTPITKMTIIQSNIATIIIEVS